MIDQSFLSFKGNFKGDNSTVENEIKFEHTDPYFIEIDPEESCKLRFEFIHLPNGTKTFKIGENTFNPERLSLMSKAMNFELKQHPLIEEPYLIGAIPKLPFHEDYGTAV